jgi:hypothetical protein
MRSAGLFLQGLALTTREKGLIQSTHEGAISVGLMVTEFIAA